MSNLTIRSQNVYIPARDFELSQQFYRELGFELTEAWNGHFDCRLGKALFRLQNYYVKEWANNFMLVFEVSDSRAWFDHVKPIIDSGRFKPARISEPETAGGAIITHIVDPSGVLLIFIQ